MTTAVSLNGVAIKRPSTFKIERYRITQSERLASGLMSMELIAKKRKFYFTYEAISATELDVILDELWEKAGNFHTLSYVENNETKSATVYVGAIPTDFHRSGDVWVWKNVTFNLIEQ